MSATDAHHCICDECGHAHAEHFCRSCGLWLCDAHRECPDCGEAAPNYSADDEED